LKYLMIYLAIVNLYALTIMYIDKNKARKGSWRIPESKLFKTALLFGSLGILIGMKLFRHKTKHNKFVFFIPSILIIQLCTLYWLFLKL
jgi:uncharacterized membrane protein YsdA (DUF1294 family)